MLYPSRGDIFMAQLDPTRGSEQAGSRPVIVVSRNAINHNSSVVVVVPVSDRANFERIYPSQVLIQRGIGGLTLNSVAMCEQVRAIAVSRLNRYLGHIPDEIMRQIDKALKITLDLSRQ